MDALYMKWVQRSLNRLNNAGLNANGSDNDSYRDQLALFKVKYSIKEAGLTDKQIGDKCQSEIIRQNHLNPEYAGWVRKVLPNAPPQANPADGLPEKEIRAFQSKQSLKVDGWVGYKTELRLIQISGKEPPVTDGGGGAPAADPWVIWFNSLPKEKRYVHMMEIAAKRYAEAACDRRIKCIAQKMRGLDKKGRVKNFFYFTSWKLEFLQRQDDLLSEHTTDKLNAYGKKGWLGYGLFDPNDPDVQEIVIQNYMESTEAALHKFYAYPIYSMENYKQNFDKFYNAINKIHLDLDAGIGKISKFRNDSHGEPRMVLAQKIVKGLMQTQYNIYNCYKDQMPGGAWDLEWLW